MMKFVSKLVLSGIAAALMFAPVAAQTSFAKESQPSMDAKSENGTVHKKKAKAKKKHTEAKPATEEAAPAE